jgi:predicted glycosyltransferase involved in capsule biosynthesis
MGKIDISSCTTIKNRIHHLTKTLPVNIEVIRKWCGKNAIIFEFIILDYDSTDGLKEWLPEFCKDKPDIEIIRMENKPIYEDQVCKNIVHNKAEGEYLLNLDADNYLDEVYLDRLYELILEGYEFISQSGYGQKDCGELAGDYTVAMFPSIYPDIAARICVTKTGFNLLGGYDEDLKGWGYTDGDFIARAHEIGLRCARVEDEYLSENCYIAHDDDDRLVNRNQTTTKGIQNLINVTKSLKNIKNGKLRANT